MPIKDLSDIRRLPRKGKIHRGFRKKTEGGKEYPVSTKHFIFSMLGDDGNEVPQDKMQDMLETYLGEREPEKIKIMFPLEDQDAVMSQWFFAYSRTRGRICRGDGYTALMSIDLDTGTLSTHESKNVEVREIVCPGVNCRYYREKRCKEMMNLMFLVPDLPGLGVWQLDTQSYHSIVHINSCREYFRDTLGRFSGIELTLNQIYKTVTRDNTTRKVPVLNLDFEGRLRDLIASGPAFNLHLPNSLLPEPVEPLPGEWSDKEDLDDMVIDPVTGEIKGKYEDAEAENEISGQQPQTKTDVKKTKTAASGTADKKKEQTAVSGTADKKKEQAAAPEQKSDEKIAVENAIKDLPALARKRLGDKGYTEQVLPFIQEIFGLSGNDLWLLDMEMIKKIHEYINDCAEVNEARKKEEPAEKIDPPASDEAKSAMVKRMQKDEIIAAAIFGDAVSATDRQQCIKDFLHKYAGKTTQLSVSDVKKVNDAMDAILQQNKSKEEDNDEVAKFLSENNL